MTEKVLIPRLSLVYMVSYITIIYEHQQQLTLIIMLNVIQFTVLKTQCNMAQAHKKLQYIPHYSSSVSSVQPLILAKGVIAVGTNVVHIFEAINTQWN